MRGAPRDKRGDEGAPEREERASCSAALATPPFRHRSVTAPRAFAQACSSLKRRMTRTSRKSLSNRTIRTRVRCLDSSKSKANMPKIGSKARKSM